MVEEVDKVLQRLVKVYTPRSAETDRTKVVSLVYRTILHDKEAYKVVKDPVVAIEIRTGFVVVIDRTILVFEPKMVVVVGAVTINNVDIEERKQPIRMAVLAINAAI